MIPASTFKASVLVFLVCAVLSIPAALLRAQTPPPADPHGHAAPAPPAKTGAPYSGQDHAPSFSNPSDVQPMPPEWSKTPIKPAGGEKPDLAIDVNQQLFPVLAPVIDAYIKEKGVKIAYTPGMCGNTTGKLTRRELDLGGGYCCAPGEQDRLPGLRYHTLGIVPLSILVHPSNPVKDLPLETIRDIYRGKIKNWKQVGGKDMPIHAISSLHCPANPGNWKLILPTEAMFGPDVREEEDMAEMIGLVAGDPSAIGMETLPVSRQFANRGEVRALSINGFSPAKPENLLKLDYPFYRVFSFTTWDDPVAAKPAALEFMKRLMSEAERLAPQMDMVPASKLREAGWKFQDEELVGEPR